MKFNPACRYQSSSIVAAAEEWKRRDRNAFLAQRLGLVRRGLAPDGALIALAKVDAPCLIGKAAPDIIGIGREIATKLGQRLFDPSGRAREQLRLFGALGVGIRNAGAGGLVLRCWLALFPSRRGALRSCQRRRHDGLLDIAVATDCAGKAVACCQLVECGGVPEPGFEIVSRSTSERITDHVEPV